MKPATLVTGGASGIGAAICRACLAAGHAVISLDREPGTPAPNLEHVAVDLTDTAALRHAAAQVTARHAITHLIHNAGAIRPALLADAQVEDLQALTACTSPPPCCWPRPPCPPCAPPISAASS